MGQPDIVAAQLLFLMSYFVGSALTEYDVLVDELMPNDRTYFEWEKWVAPTSEFCSALESNISAHFPDLDIDDDVFETLLDEHHNEWDRIPTIRDMRGGLFGVPDDVFVFWGYVFWLNAILVEYFNLLTSDSMADEMVIKLHDELSAEHDHAIEHLAASIREAIVDTTDIRLGTKQHLHVMTNAWAVHWRALLDELARTPLHE